MMSAADLSPLESEFMHAMAESGEFACQTRLGQGQPLFASSERNVIRAYVIRDVLRGLDAATGGPPGVRLQWARITGPLILDGLTIRVGLELRQCILDEMITARETQLRRLSLSGTEVTALHLGGAYIGGDLDCSDTQFTNRGGISLDAVGLKEAYSGRGSVM